MSSGMEGEAVDGSLFELLTGIHSAMTMCLFPAVATYRRSTPLLPSCA